MIDYAATWAVSPIQGFRMLVVEVGGRFALGVDTDDVGSGLSIAGQDRRPHGASGFARVSSARALDALRAAASSTGSAPVLKVIDVDLARLSLPLTLQGHLNLPERSRVGR